MLDLKARRYIVTGGSKGIGRAIAQALVERGARIVITARNRGRLETAAAEIGAQAIVADVSGEEDVVRSVREAAERLGGLDGLVNNAGIGGSSPIEALDAAEFRRILDANVIGAALMVREVLPHLRRSGGGDIVNIASTSGLKGDPGATAYCASKFALRGMTQCWQAELRPENIRVILVNPSYVETNMGGPRDPRHLKPNFLHAEDIAHTVVSALTMAPRGFIPEVTVYATKPWAGADPPD
jgi:3-oxoacyl-[acyl-carrier protein] reductase